MGTLVGYRGNLGGSMAHLFFILLSSVSFSAFAADVVDMPLPDSGTGVELSAELNELATPAKSQGAPTKSGVSSSSNRLSVSAKDRKEAVVKTISQNYPQLKQCYEQGLKKNSGLQGKVVFSWGIEDDGKVSAVEIQSSEINTKDVEKCMSERLAAWRFPQDARLKSNKDRMTYTFHFISEGE